MRTYVRISAEFSQKIEFLLRDFACHENVLHSHGSYVGNTWKHTVFLIGSLSKTPHRSYVFSTRVPHISYMGPICFPHGSYVFSTQFPCEVFQQGRRTDACSRGTHTCRSRSNTLVLLRYTTSEFWTRSVRSPNFILILQV